MKIIVAILLFAASASAQLVRGQTVQTSRGTAAAPAQAAAAPAAAAGAAAAGGAAASAGAAAPAAPVDPYADCPQCFGPGVGNRVAIQPPLFVLQKVKQVLTSLPDVRLFIDIDGSMKPTDKFGREVEVLDRFGVDPFDFEEQIEFHQNQLIQQQAFQAQQAREQQSLEQKRLRLEQELASIMARINPGTAQVGAAAQPANRFTVQV